MPPTIPHRIFSGIQPTGIPHLGNYLGALKNWRLLLDSSSASSNGLSPGRDHILYSIVDLHAMTMPYAARKLPEACLTTAACLIGTGVDPSRCIMYRQSDVREHTELAWILSCLTPLGWLQRMTQYKQKSSPHAQKSSAKKEATKENQMASGGSSSGKPTLGVGLGLLSYPVLQAADILLYKATRVPVGEDQLQHIELARDIATSFNARFCTVAAGEAEGAHPSGPYFPLPSGITLLPRSAGTERGGGTNAATADCIGVYPTKKGSNDQETNSGNSSSSGQKDLEIPPNNSTSPSARIMSLRDGTAKMSKSDPNADSRIDLLDNEDTIRAKLRAAKTDSIAGFSYDPTARPEKSNLISILAALQHKTVEEVVAEHANSTASHFKESLTQAVVETIVPIGKEVQHLLNDKQHLENVLKGGADAAREIAVVTMKDVRGLVGT